MSDDEHGLLFSAAASPTATTAGLYGLLRLDLGTNTQYLGPDRWQLQWWRPERLRVRPTKLSRCGLQHAGQYQMLSTARRDDDHI